MVAMAAFWVLALYCVVQQTFIYNFAIGNVGHIPLLAGGYIYAACFVGAAFLLRLGRIQRSSRIQPDVALAAAFLVLATIIVLGGRDAARRYNDVAGVDVTAANLRYLAAHALAFATGYSLNKLGRFRIIIMRGLLILCINVLINVDPITVLINMKVSDERFSGMYLMMGDAFALWALLACAVVDSPRQRAVIFAVSVVCLLLIGTRTALYALVIVMPVVFRLSWIRTALAIAAVAFVAMSLSLWLAETEGLASRMLVSVVTGEDSSLNSRADQFAAGRNALFDHWLLGDYAGQVRDFGDFGAYLHNILSYWRQFGLFAFMLIIALWGRAALLAWRFFHNDEAWTNPDVRFFVFISAFYGVELLTSRSYGYSLPWVVLGLGASLMGGVRQQAKRSFVISGKQRPVRYWRITESWRPPEGRESK